MKICLYVSLPIVMVACAAHPLSHAPPTPRPLGAQHAPYQPSAETPDASPVTGELTLDVALAEALMRNPKLATFSWKMRAADARALQAGLWPNPELEVEFEGFGGSGELEGADAMESTIAIGQTLPLGGDIARRREAAGYRAQLVGWDYEAARLEVITETAQRFVVTLAAQQRLTLAQQSLDLAEQVRRSIEKRVEAGAASAVELARASVPVAAARVELRRAEHGLNAARRRFAMSWADDVPAFDAVAGAFDQVRPAPDVAALAALINEHPQVARWAVEISARRAEVNLSKAKAVPDLKGMLGYRRESTSHENAMVAGFSIDLPLFDRQQGAIREAEIGVIAAAHEKRAAQLRVAAALTDAHEQLASAHDEATTLRDEALPAAQQAFDATRTAFDGGNLGYLDVIDAERTLVEMRRQYIDALQRYHIAVAQLEGLIGRPLNTTTLIHSTTG